jgi:hypothetical protein
LPHCRELRVRAKSGGEQVQQTAPLFDHLGGNGEHIGRHSEVQHLGGLEIASSNFVG